MRKLLANKSLWKWLRKLLTMLINMEAVVLPLSQHWASFGGDFRSYFEISARSAPFSQPACFKHCFFIPEAALPTKPTFYIWSIPLCSTTSSFSNYMFSQQLFAILFTACLHYPAHITVLLMFIRLLFTEANMKWLLRPYYAVCVFPPVVCYIGVDIQVPPLDCFVDFLASFHVEAHLPLCSCEYLLMFPCQFVWLPLRLCVQGSGWASSWISPVVRTMGRWGGWGTSAVLPNMASLLPLLAFKGECRLSK